MPTRSGKQTVEEQVSEYLKYDYRNDIHTFVHVRSATYCSTKQAKGVPTVTVAYEHRQAPKSVML